MKISKIKSNYFLSFSLHLPEGRLCKESLFIPILHPIVLFQKQNKKKHKKFQLVKNKEICIQNIYSDTRVLSRRSKVHVMINYNCFSASFCFSATKQTNCTRMDEFLLNATSICVVSSSTSFKYFWAMQLDSNVKKFPLQF